MNTLIAIDPGTVQSAIVRWNGKEILGSCIVPNLTALAVLDGSTDDECSIEMVSSYGMPVGKEVFETVFWIGRFFEAWRVKRLHQPEPHRLLRREVKMHICHDSRAKDGNVRQALIDRFGAPGTKNAPGLTYGLKADLWQAFALAVCTFDIANNQQPKTP